MVKVFAILGAVLGAASVGLGAFGAHGLRSKVLAGELEPRLFEVWETAAQYQMYHALALIAAAWLFSQTHSTSATVAGWAFVVGIALFSGSLYTMTLTGIKWLGAVTPLGGTALIIGWIALAVAASGLTTSS